MSIGATAAFGSHLLRAGDLAGAPAESERPAILVADASPSRSRGIVMALKGLNHVLVTTVSTAEALHELGRRNVYAVIADLDLPGGGGIDLCRLVKSSLWGERIPFVILGRVGDFEAEVRALDGGADTFLIGSVRPKTLRARVQACLRQKALIDSLDETETVLFTLAQSVEGRDPALGQHCERLALMASAIGVNLGLGPADIVALQRGGYLHDVGKVAIPDRVLLKPGPLDPEEWEIMKTHTVRGEKICCKVRSLAPVLPIIRHHHEKWDGSGYPDGLRGEEIPLLARILQFADIFDALTAERPYKRAFTPLEALEIMRSETGKGWRDPRLFEIFETIVPMFVEGSDPDSSSASLRALAESIETYRRTNLFAAPGNGRSGQPAPAKMVSGF